MIKSEHEHLATSIVHSAFEVHSQLGPGLLEKVYESCLLYDLQSPGSSVKRQVSVALHYKDLVLPHALKLDILLEDEIILEIKSVEQLHPIHHAQLISYLKLADKRLGFLINFNVVSFKSGIKRFINSNSLRA